LAGAGQSQRPPFGQREIALRLEPAPLESLARSCKPLSLFVFVSMQDGALEKYDKLSTVLTG
jgi:hypothetical protein